MLVADSIGKRYGARWVLRAASLRVLPGQVRVLIGRNGQGKSTLLKVAAGVLTPDHGVVQCDGEALLRPRLPDLARRGLFLLPDHDLLSHAFTVREHLDMMAGTFGSGAWDEIVERLALGMHLDKRPHQLSGGETRRAELAVAMVRRPRFLLADEPLRGIAPIDTDVLLGVCRSLAARGCGVILTGHEVGALLDFADHVTWCTDGTTYELGPPGVAVQEERFRGMYLGIGRGP